MSRQELKASIERALERVRIGAIQISCTRPPLSLPDLSYRLQITELEATISDYNGDQDLLQERM